MLKKKSYNIGFVSLYCITPKVTTFEVALMMILTAGTFALKQINLH